MDQSFADAELERGVVDRTREWAFSDGLGMAGEDGGLVTVGEVLGGICVARVPAESELRVEVLAWLEERLPLKSGCRGYTCGRCDSSC